MSLASTGKAYEYYYLEKRYKEFRKSKSSSHSNSLGLPELGLIVSTAVHVVLCFEFLAETVLRTHQCFGCC